MRVSLYNFALPSVFEKELNAVEPKELEFKDLERIPEGENMVIELSEGLKRLYALIRLQERKIKQAHRSGEKKQQIGFMIGFAQALFEAEFDQALGEKRRHAPFTICRGGIVRARGHARSPQR